MLLALATAKEEGNAAKTGGNSGANLVSKKTAGTAQKATTPLGDTAEAAPVLVPDEEETELVVAETASAKSRSSSCEETCYGCAHGETCALVSLAVLWPVVVAYLMLLEAIELVNGVLLELPIQVGTQKFAA